MYRIARDVGRQKGGPDFLVVNAAGMTFVPRFVQQRWEKTVETSETEAIFLANLLGRCFVLDSQDRRVHVVG